MTVEEVHQKWSVLTDNGKNDSCVSDLQLAFSVLRTALRSKFSVSSNVLSLLTCVENAAVNETKRHLINGGSAATGIVPVYHRAMVKATSGRDQ